MSKGPKIADLDLPSLPLIYYPDPHLTEACTPVEDPADPTVRRLVQRMWELMLEHKGVGLAAPQVGVLLRLFVSSPASGPGDLHVYVNPRIVSAEGSQNEPEGCLSFPGIHCSIKRYAVVTVQAAGLDGRLFQETVEGLPARIIQHEYDHLDGRLLVDRMGSVARLSYRKALKQLEAEYAGA